MFDVRHGRPGNLTFVEKRVLDIDMNILSSLAQRVKWYCFVWRKVYPSSGKVQTRQQNNTERIHTPRSAHASVKNRGNDILVCISKENFFYM